MHDLFKGAILGFLIAAPVGPIGLLCIMRTLRGGWLIGFSSGLGAAVADLFYAALAAFGMKAVTAVFTAASLPLHVVGAAFLGYLGYGSLRSRPKSSNETVSGLGPPTAFASTLALTIVNPATMFSFVAIFAAAIEPKTPLLGVFALLSGVFLGSTAWWLTLATGANVARKRLSDDAVVWVNRFSGVALIGFAVWLLLMR